MKIKVSKSIGYGATELSAFDSALFGAGVHNYNLIVLSSVIPPKTEIVVVDGKIEGIEKEWGDRLYVVMAEKRSSTPNTEVWAGIGWVQDSTGKGLFVEHHGNSEQSVREDITDSLNDLIETRSEKGFGQIKMVVSGGMCTDKPVCALAVAAYKAEPW